MTKGNVLGRVSSHSLTTRLQEHTPLLSESRLRDFVGHFFGRRQEFIALLEELQTPLYLFEPEVLHQRAQQFQAAFRTHFASTSFYYAVKSNNYPGIADVLLQNSFGLDVSSGLELEMAINLDAPNIIFSGPGKTTEELQLAVHEANRLIILIDSFQELERLNKITVAQKKDVRIGVRLTTNPKGLWRKFGILPSELPLFLEKARCCKHLHFQGLQFHTSWNMDTKAQVDFIQLLAEILTRLPKKELSSITFIDMGGGYWPEQGEWLQPAGTETGIVRKALGLSPGRTKNHYCCSSLPIEDFAEILGHAITKFILPLIPSCRICFEPGRWLCNDVMHLLMTVIDKKSADLVITDAGTNAVGWERFETDYFPVLNLSRPALTEKSCHVLGSLCTPHDVWGYNYWGEDIQQEDVLLIPTQGAYTYSLRQNFIKPVPQVVTILPLARG